jgi:hypothetical protein
VNGALIAAGGAIGEGAAEAPSFWRMEFQHFEQQSPVALLPKKPHPALHNLGSEAGLVVVSFWSFIVEKFIEELFDSGNSVDCCSNR